MGDLKLGTRPFLCRIGLHKWRGNGKHDRCERAGCHRARFLLHADSDYYYFDEIRCGCGTRIEPVTDSYTLWRSIDDGTVHVDRHWHEPAQ